MKFTKCFKHALNIVIHSKLRSWLTIIGIVIGVASVIAIVSLGTGMQQSINSQLGALGGDIITISPGFSRGGNVFSQRGPGESGASGGSSGGQATTEEIVLDRTDLQAIKGIPDVLLINPTIRGSAKITYLGKTGSVSVTGVDQKVWAQITTDTIRDGRMLDAADQNVIVIGSNLADSYFSKPLGINQMVSINGSAYRVVGVLNSGGTNVYMPIQAAYSLLANKEQGIYDTFTIKVRDENELDATILKVEQKLMMVRHVTAAKKDFSISSSKQMQETRASAMSSMSLFLVAIAAVSLLVGAVGIANTMFTSVLEKTKEIGIMKAIGARNRDIMLIFLMNSMLIGLVGGILGVACGALLSGLLPSMLGISMLTRAGSIVSLSSVVMALSVSISAGVIAGIVPAYQASRLKPVDALRYD